MSESENAASFVSACNKIQQEIYETAKSKGWWDKPREQGTIIALCHAELSEGLEALRKNLQSDHIPEFLGIEEELADTLIRIFDFAEHHKYRVAEAVIAKMAMNKGRAYKHGNKNF